MRGTAEDIIEGGCCEICNVYFEEENGYPCVCKDCFKKNPDKQETCYREL